MKTIIKTVFAVTAIALAVTSCKKQNEGTAPTGTLKSANGIAAVTPVVSDTIYGHWANPRGGNFGSIYLNLSQSASLDTASTNNSRFDVVLTGTNNSFVEGVNGYTLEYVQNVPFATIDAFTIGTAATSIGRSTTALSAANGWYGYVAPNGNTLAPNFYIIARSNDTRPDYALRFTAIVGQGTATLNRGKFVIEYGEIL
ncbi:hypothetical protein H9X96_00905 [Pedobacter sp. N36a]|uniref:hypothetical protein n=1 Tax=Pedobacter sp. N36a TaxID=2767996 RepID=UPI001656B622|nr:hypothetical protein [Pedobacter sp. N36a]MBC8984327.1 hypothetical protein [Pedobacter sp. N36a]